VLRETGLLQALTASDRLADLLPVLHDHAVSAVSGRSCILYQYHRNGDALYATSAFGVDRLPLAPWPARDVPAALRRSPEPVFVADLVEIVREAAACVDIAGAVLVPLMRADIPLGVLVVHAASRPSPGQLDQVASVGHAFVIALEQSRALSESDLQLHLRTLLQEFSRTVSSKTLSAGLEALCSGANGLFGASRTSVWLHDRRARTMVLSASSDVGYLSQETRIPTSDRLATAVLALRRDRAEFVARADGTSAATGTLSIPLKGRRRALGTMVMEEVRLNDGPVLETLDRADEIGRQLSGAIENLLLFDAVLRSRRELENTFDSLADLVAVTDQDNRIVFVNRAFTERTGKARETLIDQPLVDAVGPATRELIQRSASQTTKGLSGEVQDPELRGTFVVTLEPLPGGDNEPTGIVFVARDVTPHVQLEAERVELRNRLVQSDKLAALGRFIAGIAHELNNPLQGVLGHIELLRATGAFPKGLRRDMQRVYREADRAAKIVRNLLVFAGSRRLVRRRTSINAMLSRVLALRAPAFRAANIEVVRRHEDRLPRVSGDPLLLHQALLNIVINAEQAIGAGGGRIETETSMHTHKGTPHVLVQIRDNGPGIPPSAMPRLFEPFYTTKEVGKGTGLGLAITYGIVQDHGGQIVAANHPDGGAVFRVQLPVENG
jgi:PAS domain S-box-containing protein